jgi:serine/threonine-protein kinase
MSSRALADGVDVGTIVADTYKIVSILGKGGMGTVWEAHHARLPGKRVAIKVLHSSVAEDADALARFRREAEIACRLGHPNIVEVHDFNKLDNGSPYLILELLEGESLDQRLRAGRLPLESCEHILRQVGAALQCAHAQGVVHRDLKPQNIFLVPSPTGVGPEIAKVLDFGISKIRGSQTVKTQESTLLGTPQYMAPEQAVGHHDKVDARTDLFALAAMIYELLSGKAAFSGQNIPEVVYKVVHAEPTPIANLVPSLPAEKAAALHKALSKAQEERYPTISAFVEAFTGTALPATRVRRVSTPSDLAAQAATLDSSKIAIGQARTMESQSTEMPVAIPPPGDVPIAATLDSHSIERDKEADAAIAATIDSSKINLAQATGYEGHAGPMETMLPAPPQTRTVSLRTAGLGMLLVAALAGAAMLLLPGSEGKKATPPTVAETTSAEPNDTTEPSDSVADSEVVDSDGTDSDGTDSERHEAAEESDAVVALASAVDAGPVVEPKPSTRGRPRSVRPGVRKPPPPPPSDDKLRALLAEAQGHLNAGRFEAAVRVANDIFKKSGHRYSYVIKTKAYCHLQDLANAKAALRQVPRRHRKKVKTYCAEVGNEFH